MIKIFTTPTCKFCTIVKSYLKSRDLDFEEIDLTTDYEAVAWLQEHIGQIGVPVTVFNETEFVVGWQKDAIDNSLKKLKLI